MLLHPAEQGTESSPPSPEVAPAAAARTLKQRRATRACDSCHKRGIKCVTKGSAGCESCLSYGERCTSDRPVKRRGPRKGTVAAGAASAIAAVAATAASASPLQTPGSPLPTHWEPPQAARSPAIPMLLEFYRQLIYPFHPLMIWPPFLDRVGAEEHLHNRAFCATVMSACALASARLRQCGPLFFQSNDFEPILPIGDSPEAFHQAAKDSIWLRPGATFTIDELRATIILNITCIQKGDFTEMRFWVGAYSTMSAVMNFHDEALWPADLTQVDKEERRRLVHLAYQHSVYTAIVTGTPLEFRERQLHVSYPSEVDDEALLPLEEGETRELLPTGRDCWMHGWNRTVDLYRILEHAVDQLRNTQGAPNTVTASLIAKTDTSAYTALLADLYASLPAWARTFHDTSLDHSKHILNFQVVNILITMQNARIISTCSNGFTTEEGVAVAKELMDSLTRVPHEYLLANSVPVFHQLAGIGGILGKYTTQSASYETLLGVRSIIEGMSELLSTLHTDPLSATGKAHTTLVRYATEVDLYLSLRVEARGAGPAQLGQQQSGEGGGGGFWGGGGGAVGPVEPFDPLPLPFDLFEGSHFEDLFPDLTF